MSMQSILLNALNGFRIQDAHIESRPQGGGHIIDAFVAAFSQAGTRMHYIFRVINKRFFTNPVRLMENIKRLIEGAKTYDIVKSERHAFEAAKTFPQTAPINGVSEEIPRNTFQ